MSYRLGALLVCALFALTAALPVSAADDDIAVRVATSGSTVVIDVELPLKVSPEEAWPTITDYDRMTEFIPNLKESRIVSRDGNRLVVEQKGRARRGPVSFAFENVRDVLLVPPLEIRTRLVSGSMRSATSHTRLERTETGSRLTNHGEYTVSPLLPVAMVKDSILLETREQFALLRAEVMRRHAKLSAAR